MPDQIKVVKSTGVPLGCKPTWTSLSLWFSKASPDNQPVGVLPSVFGLLIINLWQQKVVVFVLCFFLGGAQQ